MKLLFEEFMGVPAVDLPYYDLQQHFYTAADFIQVGSSAHHNYYDQRLERITESHNLANMHFAAEHQAPRHSISLLLKNVSSNQRRPNEPAGYCL
jgi:hypothetical protein